MKIQHGLYICLIGYSLILNGYLLAHAACQDCFPVLAQMNHIAHWLMLTGFIGFAIALLFPARKWLVWFYILPILAFLGWYGELFLPHSIPDTKGTEFTAGTYNVVGFIADPNETFQVVKEMDVDILAFEELRPTLWTYIETDLAEVYPYRVSKVVQGFEGLGLISKYPIIESNIVLDVDFAEIDLAALRYLRAVVEIGEQQIVVYVFHPTIPQFSLLTKYDDKNISTNFHRLIEQLQTETLPLLLLCDCNTTPRTPQYHWLNEILDDSFQEVGWGLGLTHNGYYRNPYRATRIDYIWHDSNFIALQAEAWHDSGGSDHYPMWAKLRLQDD